MSISGTDAAMEFKQSDITFLIAALENMAGPLVVCHDQRSP